MSKHQIIFLRNQLDSNHCEFHFIDTKTGLDLCPAGTSHESAFSFAKIETNKKAPNHFTKNSLLQIVNQEDLKVFAHAFINYALEVNQNKNNVFEITLNKTLYKKKVKGSKEENNEPLDEMNTKFTFNSVEDLSSFLISESLGKMIDLSRKLLKNEDGSYESITSQEIKIIKDVIKFDPDLQFKISIIGSPVVVETVKGGTETLNEITMADFITNYILTMRNKTDNFHVKCVNCLIETIDNYLLLYIIGGKMLQANNKKIFTPYVSIRENVDLPYLSVINGELNTYNEAKYKLKRRDPVDGKTFTEYFLGDGVIKKYMGNNSNLNQLYNEITDAGVDGWYNVIEEELPLLTQFLKHHFKDCWVDFLKMCAYKWTYPHKKIPCGFIFHGVGGTGKTLLLKTILPLMIFKNLSGVVESATVSMSSQFNSYMAESLILTVEETNDFQSVKNLLKTVITDDLLNVEGKGTNKTQVVNKNWVFVASNEENVSQLLADENEDRRYVCIKHGEKETLYNVMGIKEGSEGAKLKVEKLKEEASKIVALFCNKNIFDFEGKDKNYSPAPIHFSKINVASKMKQGNKFSHFLPVFKLLEKQITTSNKNPLDKNPPLIHVTMENEVKGKDRYIINYKSETNDLNKKYFVGFNLNEDEYTSYLFEEIQEQIAYIKGCSVESIKKDKFSFKNFSNFKSKILNDEMQEALYTEFNNWASNNNVKSIKKDNNKFLSWIPNKPNKGYKMFGKDYVTIQENINNIITFLEQYNN